jgi:hypothetical protein
MRSPPSTKARTMATGGITKAATVGIENWFQERTIALSSSEQALVFFSQQQNGHQAQYEKCQCQECHEGGSSGTAGKGVVSTKSASIRAKIDGEN